MMVLLRRGVLRKTRAGGEGRRARVLLRWCRMDRMRLRVGVVMGRTLCVRLFVSTAGRCRLVVLYVL
jgi:hypothetical protein